jgi:hypothetical protein
MKTRGATNSDVEALTPSPVAVIVKLPLAEVLTVAVESVV